MKREKEVDTLFGKKENGKRREEGRQRRIDKLLV